LTKSPFALLSSFIFLSYLQQITKKNGVNSYSFFSWSAFIVGESGGVVIILSSSDGDDAGGEDMFVSDGLEGAELEIFRCSKRPFARSMYCPKMSLTDLSMAELSSANRTTWWPWLTNFSSSCGSALADPLIAAWITKNKQIEDKISNAPPFLA